MGSRLNICDACLEKHTPQHMDCILEIQFSLYYSSLALWVVSLARLWGGKCLVTLIIHYLSKLPGVFLKSSACQVAGMHYYVNTYADSISNKWHSLLSNAHHGIP